MYKKDLFTTLNFLNSKGCCNTVFLSSEGIQSAIDGNNPKSVKLGAYNYLTFSNGKRAYKLMTNKTDQEKEFFLHYGPLGDKWAVCYFDIKHLTCNVILLKTNKNDE